MVQYIYFPEYKTVYGKPDAKSGILILKEAPLPEDILTLGIDGVNQIWRDAKLRAVGKARAKTLIEAEHSVGSKEGAVSGKNGNPECFWRTMNPEIYVFRK